MSHAELMNIVFSCLMDGGSEKSPITESDARYTIECWKSEGIEWANTITPKQFVDAWNDVIQEIH